MAILTLLASGIFGFLCGVVMAWTALSFAFGVGFLKPGWWPFFGTPGFVLGVAIGLFLLLRAKRVNSFLRLLIECASVTSAVSTGVIQLLFPLDWDPPRLRLALATVIAGAGLGALASWLLKPLYWAYSRSLLESDFA